jgi:hypothetical protein
MLRIGYGEIRERRQRSSEAAPDCAALHPGYAIK